MVTELDEEYKEVSEPDQESRRLCYSISGTLLAVDRARRRASSWTDARYIHASPLPTVALKSLASRRLRLSQAKVRSTTQRHGRTEKPVDRSERLTITPAEGLASRPTRSRACCSSRKLMTS
jgi:hypothetical protein